MKIVPTLKEDFETILWLFDEAMKLRNRQDYIVWKAIDQKKLAEDIVHKMQYKIIKDDKIICIFSIQFNDRFIWRNRDQNDAIYLHRVVTHPHFKGQRLFQTVLNWTISYAKTHDLKYVRLDTIAKNTQLRNYYLSYDFRYLETYRTPNIAELPLQNRDVDLALYELAVK